MNGTNQLAKAINRHNIREQTGYENCPEPLRAMIYAALGEELASAIDGTDLYAEIVDHLEVIV